VTNARRAEAEKSRDLLADLAEVLRAEPVRAADIPALLRDLAPEYKPYASITGVQVHEQFGALASRSRPPATATPRTRRGSQSPGTTPRPARGVVSSRPHPLGSRFQGVQGVFRRLVN
jgi:hypothetical protein